MKENYLDLYKKDRRKALGIATGMVLLAILPILLLFIATRPLSKEKATERYEQYYDELISSTEEGEYNRRDLERKKDFLEKYQEKVDDDMVENDFKERLNLALLTSYNRSNDEDMLDIACDIYQGILEDINQDKNTEALVVINANISLHNAVEIVKTAYRCDEKVDGKLLNKTALEFFGTEKYIVLVYYNNVPLEVNFKWIERNFDQKYDDVKIDDENHRDALRIMVFEKDSFKPHSYKQFRSESIQKNYFQQSYKPFTLSEDSLFWERDGKLAYKIE